MKPLCTFNVGLRSNLRDNPRTIPALVGQWITVHDVIGHQTVIPPTGEPFVVIVARVADEHEAKVLAYDLALTASQEAVAVVYLGADAGCASGHLVGPAAHQWEPFDMSKFTFLHQAVDVTKLNYVETARWLADQGVNDIPRRRNQIGGIWPLSVLHYHDGRCRLINLHTGKTLCMWTLEGYVPREFAGGEQALKTAEGVQQDGTFESFCWLEYPR